MWKIQKIVKKGDYLYAVIPEHPKKTKNNYVLHHRAVMEIFLDRLLTNDEIIHHKDHNKHNNLIENLELMTKTEHSKLHAKRGRNILELTCPICKKQFFKEKRQIHSENPKCSRKCNGINSRKIQLNSK